MSSHFAQYDATASAVISAVMGEAWAVTPQATLVPNGQGGADPARPPRMALGIFSNQPQMLGEIKGYLPPVDRKPGLFAGDAKVEFDPRLPANAGLVLHRLDTLCRLSDTTYWRVQAVAPDGMGRLICHITLNG